VRRRKGGLGYIPVALITITLLVLATYFAFTKGRLPFKDRYEVTAVVQTANQLRPDSFVRIAGVNVGKVKSIEPVGDGEQAARIRMEIEEKGTPIHKDATLKIRPRILLEGNFFVELEPGSPSAPILEDGDTIPINQTAGPVQFDQILGAFERDTRDDLKIVLRQLHRGLANGGAEAINRTMPNWAPAYRGSSIVNDAMLGRFEHDLSGYIDGAGRFAEGLSRNGAQLRSLVTDLRTTAGAIAVRDQQLEQAIAELPRTLRTGRPALAALNRSFPTLRRFTADLRPGVRSAPDSLDAQVPFVRQLRGLVSQSELRGLTADLKPTVRSLARMNKATIPLLEQVRAASSCQNEVILPWTLDRVEDPDFPAIGPVYQEQPKPLVGLAGESRTFDANGQWFRVSLNGTQFATPIGAGRFMFTDRAIAGVNPPPPSRRPALNSSVPCETQQQPDLRTNPGRPPAGFEVAEPPADALNAALGRALAWLQTELDQVGQGQIDVSDTPVSPDDLQEALPALPQTPQLPQGGGGAPQLPGVGR
jgi:phospholipid/cholesterol/gamma-HCH transport system substrate-binding protein